MEETAAARRIWDSSETSGEEMRNNKMTPFLPASSERLEVKRNLRNICGAAIALPFPIPTRGEFGRCNMRNCCLKTSKSRRKQGNNSLSLSLSLSLPPIYIYIRRATHIIIPTFTLRSRASASGVMACSSIACRCASRCCWAAAR